MSYDPKKLPVLYLLMRTDLESMNAGKAIAQGSHAATMFAFRAARIISGELASYGDDLKLKLRQWMEDRDFGTKLTLDCESERQIQAVVDFLKHTPAVFALSDVVIDPTYPIRDGKVTHAIPLLTCGYVFGYKEDLVPLMQRYGLHA